MIAVQLIHLVLRLAGAIYCAQRADNLNRSAGAWSVFGFFFPIIAMIWVSCLSPKTLWVGNEDNK